MNPYEKVRTIGHNKKMIRLLFCLSVILSVHDFALGDEVLLKIHVRLASYSSSQNFRIQGLQLVAGDKVWSRIPSEDWQLSFNSERGQLSLAPGKEQDGQLILRPRLGNKREILIQARNISTGDRRFPGEISLVVIPEENGKFRLDLVSDVDIESYVAGVVRKEMPTSWPLEALKAQAVAARSYALAVMGEKADRQYRHFDIDSTVADQVYEHPKEGHNLKDKAQLATFLTDSQVLYDLETGKVLKTFFHADCGGRTATAQEVWGINSPLVVVTDKSCPSSPKGHWKFQISDQLFQEKLAKVYPNLHQDPLKGVELVRRHPGDRISTIRLKTNKGNTLEMSAQEFRKVLGFFDFKSTQFVAQKAGSQWIFQGRGFGHGVGLCQWGTRSLALQGKHYREILNWYYSMASLVKLKPIEFQQARLDSFQVKLAKLEASKNSESKESDRTKYN